MESELKEATYVKDTPNSVEPKIPEIKSDAPGLLTTFSAGSSNEQWRQTADKAYEILSSLPEYMGKIFSEYRRPIVTVGLIFGSVVSVKLTLALLSAINDIPLLQPTFELIGLGYTAWFAYRYLLKASQRQELEQEFNKLKDQVVGQDLK